MDAPQAGDPPIELRKQVEGARRRHLWWIALAGATAANAALALVLHDGGARPPRVMTVTVEAPPPAPAPVFAPHFTFVTREAPAAAAPFTDLGPCPAPYTGAPPGRPSQPPEPVIGLAAAPTDSRWIAAWSLYHLYVSRDGGVHWRRILDGAGRVMDADFDCHGRALALRDGVGLGVRDGERETWRTVPIAIRGSDADEEPGYPPHLFGGGRAIAVIGSSAHGDVGQAFAAVSDDAGAGWRLSDLGYWEGETPHGGWRGDTLRIAMAWHDCSYEGTNVIAVAPGGTSVESRGSYAREYAVVGASVLGHGHECRTPDGEGVALCVLTADDTWRPLPGPAFDPEAELRLVDGPVAVAVVGDQIHRVGARRIGRGRPWSLDWHPLGTDRAGRLWGTDEDGALLRR